MTMSNSKPAGCTGQCHRKQHPVCCGYRRENNALHSSCTSTHMYKTIFTLLSISHIGAVHVSSHPLFVLSKARLARAATAADRTCEGQIRWDRILACPPQPDLLPQSYQLCLNPQLLVLTPTPDTFTRKLDTMAAALMSKSFAGASLRSAVPTKGQVRHRLPNFLFSTAAPPIICCNPFMSLAYTVLYYCWCLLACGMRASAAGRV